MRRFWNARSVHETDVSAITPVHSLWPSLVGGGFVQFVLGAVGLLLAGVTTLMSVIFFGVLLVAGGIVELVQAFRARGEAQGLFLYLLAGIVSLLAGIALLFNPLAGAMSLTLLIALLLIVGGLVRLFAGTRQGVPARGWAIASGIVTALLGVVLLIDFPTSSVWSIGAIVSATLIVIGFANVLLGFELRNRAQLAVGRVTTVRPSGPGDVGPAGAI